MATDRDMAVELIKATAARIARDLEQTIGLTVTFDSAPIDLLRGDVDKREHPAHEHPGRA
jgi:hypothetical protein